MKRIGADLKIDFPIFSRTIHGYPLVYLDNAVTTHKPQRVLDAVIDFYTKHNANIFRSVYTIAEEATALYEMARNKVAAFIGADSSELIFTGGTTEGINFVASTWAQKQLKPDDEILLSGMEHHANLLPWQRCAQQTGARLVVVPINADGTIQMDQLVQLTTKKTRLIAVSHIGNVLGTHQDISAIVKTARSVGARVLVDAAQSVPHQRINVHELDCDFLVFSGHKMLGPTGVGCLYIRKELHEEVPPYQLGGGMVANVELGTASWMEAPFRFEAGTPPIAQAIGLGAAVDYLQEEVDFDSLQAYEASLCARLIEGLQGLPNVVIYGPLDQLQLMGHQVSFNIIGIHPHDVAAYCDTYGICVRAGFHCAQPLATILGMGPTVRVSFYAYNTPEDVDWLVQTLAHLIG